MDSFQVYRDMKVRTNGEINIGVVRSGADRQVDFYQEIHGSACASQHDG